MSATNEIWQVMIQGEVYEADIESLKQWVAEGRLLPTDHVRKGKLSWIQADRAPAMRRIFSGEDPPFPASPPVSTPLQEEPASSTQQSHVGASEPPAEFPANSDHWTAGEGASDACYNHPQLSPEYVCRICGSTFCKECPNFVGTSKIALCPLCGDLCQPYQKLLEKSMRQSYQRSGFGFEDFGRALGYPLKSIVSLIAGAILYGLLLLAGFWGHIAAYAIMFGCISLVINRVSSGKLDSNFVPDFNSYWDDVVIPTLLGFGITIVTLGPAILLIVAIWFSGLNGLGSILMEPAQLLYTSLTIILLFLLAFVWAGFYYPMALAVAGYTGDFWATVNPLVGLDTIRRMGVVYVKAFLMYLCMLVLSVIVGGIIYMMTAPFNMPLVGNLPAKFLDGMVTFYINLVIAFILGLALYKCADKLDIPTD
jgi:hypothetical protein